MHDDQLAEALESERDRPASQADRQAANRRRWWGAAGLVGLAVVVGTGPAWWPSAGSPEAPAATTAAESSDEPSQSAIPPGADLLTEEWPDRALAAFSELGAERLGRVLLTTSQVQAAAQVSGTEAWHDLLYVDDLATDLGTTTSDTTGYQTFTSDEVAAGAIASVAAQAPGLVGLTDAPDQTYVVVERDAMSDGSPVRISVYLVAGEEHHLVVADGSGAILSAS